MKNVRIVVASRGWVFVGAWSQEGDEVVISKAQNIRRWGTSRGLGELAAEGPKSQTQLDAYGVVRLHRLNVIATLDCNVEAWAKALK